jgi:uncharacterized protein YegP (UPF0339 family)
MRYLFVLTLLAGSFAAPAFSQTPKNNFITPTELKYAYEIYKTKDGLWMWQFIEDGKNIIAVSATAFKTKEEVTASATAMRRLAAAPIVIDSKTSEMLELEKRLQKLTPEERAALMQRLNNPPKK